MKKVLGNILIITIVIWTGAALTASAQNDSLPPIPLYENATSKNAPSPDNRNVVSVASDNATIFADNELRKFYNLYAAGKYHEALSLSKKMSTEHFGKFEHQVHQKYSIAAYKEMEYNEEADSVAKIFLKKNPFYTPNPYDPVSFREVLSNYYTMPRFSVWVSLANPFVYTQIDTVNVITIDTMQRKPDYDYSAFSVQLGFEYHIFKFLSIAVAPTFSFYNYTRSIQRHKFATYYYSEKYAVVSLPLRVEAGMYKENLFFAPSIYVGIQPKYVIKSRYQSYEDILGQLIEEPDYKSNTEVKNRFNYAIFGGARLSFNHTKRFTYFAEATFSMDMLPINDPSKKYSTYDALFRDLYINDAYRVKEISIMAGVKVNLQYSTEAKNGYGYYHK